MTHFPRLKMTFLNETLSIPKDYYGWRKLSTSTLKLCPLPIIWLCEPGAPCITSWPGPLAGVLQLGHLPTVRRIPAKRTHATAPERFLMHDLSVEARRPRCSV